MPSSWLQPVNRHIVAVVALLVSSAGGFLVTPLQLPLEERHQRRRLHSAAVSQRRTATVRPAQRLLCARTPCSDSGHQAQPDNDEKRRSVLSRQQQGWGAISPRDPTRASSTVLMGARWPFESLVSMSLHPANNSNSSQLSGVSGESDDSAGKTDGGAVSKRGSGKESSPSSRVSKPPRNATAAAVPASGSNSTAAIAPGIAAKRIELAGVSMQNAAGNVTAHANATRTDLNGSKVSNNAVDFAPSLCFVSTAGDDAFISPMTSVVAV